MTATRDSAETLAAAVDRTRAGAGLAALPQVGLLTLENEDVRRWAHGMFTNHIKGLEPGQGNRNCMCDDRGRVGGIADVYCLAEDQLLLVLDGVDAAWFAERYKMFLMLDDIEVDEVEDATLLTLQGPSTDGVLAIVGLPLPAAPHAHLLHEGVRVLRKDRTGLGGVDLIVPNDALEDWRTRLLDAGAHLLDPSTLDALRILAAQVSWPRDGTDKSMVHELALNEECCNFSKGCYVGQEVINRIDVKGQVQKRLTLVRLEGPLPELPAEVVLEGAPVGRLTSGADLGDHTVALGVIRKKAWEPGTTLDVNGTTATVG